MVLWGIVVIGAGAGAYLYVQQSSHLASAAKPPAAVLPAERAPAAPTPAPADPVPPAPPAPDARAEVAAAAARDAARVQGRIATVRAYDSVSAQMVRADFSGAATALESWVAARPDSAQGAEIVRQIARLRAASQALPRLLQEPGALTGARIPVGNAMWPVMRVADGRLICQVQAQFGIVERPLELSALSHAARVQLLQRVDAARQTALAPTYLLGLGNAEAARALLRDDAPETRKLRAAADEVDALARDSRVLAALDAVEGAVSRGELAAAGAKLDEVVAAHAAHEFITIAYADRIAAWRSSIASAPPPAMPKPGTEPTPGAKPGDSYPGLPVLNLSGTVMAGDPDRQRLLSAAQWAASTGNWARHFTELKSALAAAANSGPWQQHASNLDHLLRPGTPALALEQAKFIRAVGVDNLNNFGAEAQNQEFLNWLFLRPAVLSAFNRTIQPEDKARDALLQWRVIWNDDPENRDTLANLAIACALVFDQPVRISADVYGFGKNSDSASASPSTAAGPTEASAMSRFRFYRDSAKRGTLKVPLAEMMPWELVWVVDAPVPESELLWAQKNANWSRHNWSEAYGHIRYRMDRATQGVNPYKAYTLAEIEKEGGICGDQAYFAAMTAKANGIPAMVISGEGDRGGHAWFGYERARNDWNLNTGRYADNYAAGTTRHPQTGRAIKEQELRQLTDPVRRTDSYEKSEALLAFGTLLTDPAQRDLAALVCDAALRAAPKNFGAWTARLERLAEAKVPSAEWLKESARMRTTFREFPDLVQTIDKREADYLATSGDSDAARKQARLQTTRMERKDEDRTDLILDSVFREADLAAKAGDAEAAGRVYRDALKNKGEEVVAFKKIAARYYDWAKTNGRGPDVVRDLISYFDRKHPEPTNDTFAMGAYRGVLQILTGMAKEQGLDQQQRRLDRREEKLKELEEKLGKAQSKGADR